MSLRWREGPQGRSRNRGGKDLSWGSTGLAAGLAGLATSSTSSGQRGIEYLRKDSGGAVRSVTGFILEIVDLGPGTVQVPSNARPRQVLGEEQKSIPSKNIRRRLSPWFLVSIGNPIGLIPFAAAGLAAPDLPSCPSPFCAASPFQLGECTYHF